MRKLLDAISLVGLAVLGGVTWSALYGANPLPERVATHFDATGNANAWGSPGGLIILPGIAVALYLIMTLVAQFPSAFNYPVRVTAENRERLQALALDMISWIKLELICLFGWIQWIVIAAMRVGHGTFSRAVGPWTLVVVLGTVGCYILAMVRAR